MAAVAANGVRALIGKLRKASEFLCVANIITTAHTSLHRERGVAWFPLCATYPPRQSPIIHPQTSALTVSCTVMHPDKVSRRACERHRNRRHRGGWRSNPRRRGSRTHALHDFTVALRARGAGIPLWDIITQAHAASTRVRHGTCIDFFRCCHQDGL